jgi:hypothetical protein
MMETNLLWTKLEGVIRALLMLLSGNLASGPDVLPPEELARQVNGPSRRALLFLEPEGTSDGDDEKNLAVRLNQMNIKATTVEFTSTHLIYLLNGPLLSNGKMKRLVSPGHFVIGGIKNTRDWQNLIPANLRRELKAESLPPSVSLPALASDDKTTLQQAMPILEKNGLTPFIFTRNEDEMRMQKKRYFLSVLHPESQITDDSLKTAEIERSEHPPGIDRYQIRMVLNAEGQKLLNSLSAANIGHPVAVVLDGEALSLPIVVSRISSDSLVISPYGNAGDFSNHAQDMLLLRTIINHGPLNTRWKMVHMARLPGIRQRN